MGDIVQTEKAAVTLTRNVIVQNNINSLTKSGKVVTLILGINANAATLDLYKSNVIGSIPSGFFPSRELRVSIVSQAKGYYVFAINSSGEIMLQPFDNKASSNNIFIIGLTWICD